MHCHRTVLPIVQSTCAHVRAAATAAKPKVPWSHDAAVPPSTHNLNSSQWSISSQSSGSAADTSQLLPDLSKWSPPSPSSPASRVHRWSLSNPSSSKITSNRSVLHERSHLASHTQEPQSKFLNISERTSKHNSHPSVAPKIPGPGRATSRPPRLAQEPSAKALNKWARPSVSRVTDRSTQWPTPSHDHDRRVHPRARIDIQNRSPYGSLEGLDFQNTSHPELEQEQDAARHTPRPPRTTYRERGSILDRIGDDIAIPKHSRASPTRSGDHSLKVQRKNAQPKGKHVAADVYIPSTVSVGTLSRLLGVKLEKLQHKMHEAGMGKESSYDHVLTSDYATLLAEEFGLNPIVNDEAAFDIYPSPLPENPAFPPSRPPVVTIMGHVDHGKTTLLDSLRSSSVAKGEAGGITQHIGAFSVPVPAGSGSADGPRSITFLDTPGHAAFSAMRARGAGVTDIVVLVIAADDGIMPQTKEVIDLIKKDEGKVGLVVAINKVDKPGADVVAVQNALLADNIQLEVFGGDVPSVEVSGLTGQGLSSLVETLSLMAEMQDLRAEREGPCHGHVLESRVQKGLGPVATVLVLRGCLKPGSYIISGVSYAKVRVMNDSSGDTVRVAYPGMAVTVSGWKSLPNAGDEVLQGSEGDVKKAIANRRRKSEVEASLVDVEAINANRRLERERRESGVENGGVETRRPLRESIPESKELRLVVKGDVSGSVEAVVGALQGIGNQHAAVKVVSSGVGEISESDVMMAKAAEGIVVGFSVSTPRAVEVLAAQNAISIVSSNIIYKLMDNIKERVIALLPTITERKVTGEATVLQLFDIHLKTKMIKKVAGCRVTNGIIEKSRDARVIRDGVIVHNGSLDTMRYLKREVTEIRKGSECGLSFSGFSDIREGDLIQMYQTIEKPGIL